MSLQQPHYTSLGEPTREITNRPCKSEKELINFGMQIAESTVEDRGIVKVIVKSVHQI